MAKAKNDEGKFEYDLETLMTSVRYAGAKDILPIVIGENELLTLDGADKRVNEFLEREVQ